MRPIRSDLPRLKQALFYTLVFSLAAHAYMYFTFAPSHDSVSTLINSVGDSRHQLSLGRFMQPLYWLLRGRLPVPWLVGLLSILYLAAGGYCIVAVLGIERRSSVIVLCGILSTNLAVTATNATYQYSVDMYTLAMAFACAGAWLWVRFPRWGALAAIPCFTCCMGLYQAYIDVAIGLALLLLMRRVLDGEPFSALWKRAVRYGLSLLAGAILYYALVKLSLVLTGTAMSASYNGLGNLLDSDLPSLLGLVPRAYWDFFWFFMGGRSYNPLPVRLCVMALGLLGAWRWIALVRARRIRGLELAMLALCAALLPLGLNFICVLSVGSVHDLMVYSYFLVYAALLLAFDRKLPPAETPRFSLRQAAVFLCGYILLFNVVFANGAYFKKQLLYETASQYAFSIVEQMERQPDYEPGVTPVAFIGSFSASRLVRETDEYFTMYRDVVGLSAESSLTYPETFSAYCQFILGRSVSLVSDSALLTEIQYRRATLLMPVFPKEGCCQMQDGIMVVKLA